MIRRDGAYLVGRRPSHKRHGGLFEFPGGKVRPEESDPQAVARELDEELALRVAQVGRVLFSAGDPGAPYLVHFVAVRAEGVPRALEHEELRWAAPEELLGGGVPLAPSDARFVREALSDVEAGWADVFRA